MSEKANLADFHEKLYFHEIDAREKLHSRVSIPLAVLISLVGGLGFMIQNLNRSAAGLGVNLFYCAFGIACLFVLLGAYYLKSAASGHDYEFLAPAKDWEDQRVHCETKYAEFDNKEELVSDAVRGNIRAEYIRCASINALVNDSRSYCLFLTIKFLIISSGFVLLAFLIFFFGGLDKSLQNKPLNVNLIQPVTMKGVEMTSQKVPPPPPPPPPARVVREDKRPPTPQPQPQERKHGD